MDILSRAQLKHGQTCFFFVSSFENPYVYVKFEGIVEEVYIVYEDQTIYRIAPTRIIDDIEYARIFLNRHSYKSYDIELKLNKTKRFFTFDVEDMNKFVESKLTDKFLFEVSSATTFSDINDMHVTYNELNKYLIKKLNDTIAVLQSRLH